MPACPSTKRDQYTTLSWAIDRFAHLELRFRLRGAHAPLLHHGPERSVEQVVDVTYRSVSDFLPP